MLQETAAILAYQNVIFTRQGQAFCSSLLLADKFHYLPADFQLRLSFYRKFDVDKYIPKKSLDKFNRQNLDENNTNNKKILHLYAAI